MKTNQRNVISGANENNVIIISINECNLMVSSMAINNNVWQLIMCNYNGNNENMYNQY